MQLNQSNNHLGTIAGTKRRTLLRWSIALAVSLTAATMLFKFGDHTMSNPYLSTDPAVTGFVTSQNNGPDNRGGTAPYAPSIMNNGIAGTTTNNVIGFSALTSSGSSPIALGTGFNAVIIDGYNSATAASVGAPDNFSFTVDPTGLVTLTDATTGKTQQVSGVSFLIFDSAATGTDANGNPDYQQMYFIGGANQTEVTQLYNAAFGRQPDLGGVEYYMNELNGGLSFQQISAQFMASPEFQTRFGANVSDTQFVTNLYQNVLHRTPVQSEIAYYTAALANNEAGSIVNTTNPVAWSRQQELLNFTNSPENQIDTAGFVVNTAGTATNGLVYSPPAAGSETATQALTQASTTGILDTTLVNSTGVTSAVTIGSMTINPPATQATALFHSDSVSTTATSGTIVLSTGINGLAVTNYDASTLAASTLAVYGASTGGSLVVDPTGTVNFYGTGNRIFAEGNGGLPSTLAVTVTGFTNGDTIQMYGLDGHNFPISLISPAGSTPITGSALPHIFQGTIYAINVGAVGSGSATEVAAAAQQAYTPADAPNEWALFYGQITTGSSAGGTAIYDWNQALSTAGADVHGTHSVNASDFSGGVILVGVSPSAINASTFYH